MVLESKKLIFLRVLILCPMVVLSICLSGCSLSRDLKVDDPFRDLYSVYTPPESESVSSSSKSDPVLTFSAFDLPLGLFCRIVSDRFDVGLVFSESLSGKTVTGEFRDTPLSEVLSILSRQLGVKVVQVGRTFYLGSLTDDDRGILVRRVSSFDRQALDDLLKGLVSATGRSLVLPNSVIVVSDTDLVLRRVSEALAYYESIQLSQWIVQLYFIALRRDALIEAGFEVQPSGTISYNVSESTVEAKDFKIDGFFKGLASSGFADIFAQPMFILRDSVKGRWFDGQTIPIAQRAVSSEGTVTTTGYDYVDVGFDVTATIFESVDTCRLVLDVDVATVSGYVEEAPIKAKTQTTIDVSMVPGQIYLLSELQKYTQLDKQSNSLDLSRDTGKVVIQLWAKVYRIKGGSLGMPRKPFSDVKSSSLDSLPSLP